MTMTPEQERQERAIFKAIGKALKGDGGFKDYHSVESQLYRKCPIAKGSLGEFILNIIDPSWEADAKYTNGQRFDIGEEFAKANPTIFIDDWHNATIRKEAVARLIADAPWIHFEDETPKNGQEIWLSCAPVGSDPYVVGTVWIIDPVYKSSTLYPTTHWKPKDPPPDPYSGEYGAIEKIHLLPDEGSDECENCPKCEENCPKCEGNCEED